MQSLSIRKNLFVKVALGVTVLTIAASAQSPAPAPADTAKQGWSRKLDGTLNIAQSSYDNWAKGGTDALSYTLNLGGLAVLELEKFSWSNRAKAVYGRTKEGDKGSRKSADELDFESILTYKVSKLVNPFASVAALTQFGPGFDYTDYDKDPTKPRIQNSDYFNPAYFTQTVGVGVEPLKALKERMGFTMKQTVGKYGFKEMNKDFKQEYGLSSITEYDYSFNENILAATRLEVFTNFKGWDEVDGRWTNKLTAKMNKFLNVSFEYEKMYDKDLSDSDQTREALSIGISFLSL